METSFSKPKTDFYHPFYWGITTVLETQFKRYVVGEENVPDEPAIYAVNHVRFEDSLLVASAYTHLTGKPMRFGAKKEYFDGDGIPVGDKMMFGKTVKFFMEHGRMIPVDRGDGRQALQTLNHYSKVYLQNGDSIALHPEGTRSLDGRLNRFRTGVARIAIENEVPTVPVGVMHGEKVGRLGRRATFTVFGEPLPADAFGDLPRQQRAEAMTKEIENRVAELSYQEQSSEYAAISSES